MDMTEKEKTISLEVIREVDNPIETTYSGAKIEYINLDIGVEEKGVTSHVVEIVRTRKEPLDIDGSVKMLEVVKPGGSVVNVGVGPHLPENPYEGLVWIKI